MAKVRRGRRPSAGSVQLSIVITRHDLARIDLMVEEAGARTRSEVVRALLRAALRDYVVDK